MRLDVHIKQIVDDSNAVLRDLEAARNEVRERDLWLGNAREEVKEAMRERDEALRSLKLCMMATAGAHLDDESDNPEVRGVRRNVKALMSQRAEVGAQLVAAQAEIARLTKGVADVRRFMLAQWRPPAEAVLGLVEEIIAANPDQVAKARENPKLAGWFVGQTMKATGGKANPKAVNQIVAQKLNG